MKKTIILIICMILLLGTGCTDITVEEPEITIEDVLERIEYIPEVIDPHYVSRGPNLVFGEDENFRYCVVTMGNESIKEGNYTILKEELDGQKIVLELNYVSAQEELSLDFHFVAFKFPKDYSLSISVMKDGITKLAGSID